MHLGTGASVSTVPGRTVRVEILARRDCPSRDLAISLVDEAIFGTGVPARVEVIDVVTDVQAQRRRFLGSPTVRVDGRDVDPWAEGRTDYSLSCRIYRTERGLAGGPDESWIRAALLRAAELSAATGA
jgi:hypothetical protein